MGSPEKILNTQYIALLDPLIGTCRISSFKLATIIYFKFSLYYFGRD